MRNLRRSCVRICDGSQSGKSHHGKFGRWKALAMLRGFTVLIVGLDSVLGKLEENDECLMNIAAR